MLSTSIRGMACVLHPALIIMVVMSVFPAPMRAQLTASLQVSARPSPYIAEWRSQRITAILTVMNRSTGDVQGKIRCIIKRDDDPVARTRTSQLVPITFPPGMSTWYPETLVPEGAIEYSGHEKETAARTGMLPSGDYQLCLDIIDPASELSLLEPPEPVCRMFLLTGWQGPVLLEPDEGAQLDPRRRPVFRWTPVSPPMRTPVRYHVLVFEVLDGQRQSQALRSNMPILDQEVVNMTQLIWPADHELPGRMRRHVWTVRALDDNGNPLGENDGCAEPRMFEVGGNAVDLMFGTIAQWTPKPDALPLENTDRIVVSLQAGEQVLGVRNGCELCFVVDCSDVEHAGDFTVRVVADGDQVGELPSSSAYRSGGRWNFLMTAADLARPVDRDGTPPGGTDPHAPTETSITPGTPTLVMAPVTFGSRTGKNPLDPGAHLLQLIIVPDPMTFETDATNNRHSTRCEVQSLLKEAGGPDPASMQKSTARTTPSFLPMSQYTASRTWMVGRRRWPRCILMKSRFAVHLPDGMTDLSGYAVEIRLDGKAKAHTELTQGRRDGNVVSFDLVPLEEEGQVARTGSGTGQESSLLLNSGSSSLKMVLLDPRGGIIDEHDYAPGDSTMEKDDYLELQ